MKRTIVIAVTLIALMLSSVASANESGFPTDSASATVNISLTIGPRESSREFIQQCASELVQRMGKSHGDCARNIQVALVTTDNDRRRRIEPI